MTRLGPRRFVVVIVALIAVACGSDDKSIRVGLATTTAPGGQVSTTALQPTVELHAYNVRLFNSEESDNALRVQLQSPASKVSVTVRGGIPVPNEVLQVCPAVDINTHGTPSKCTMPRDGEPVEIEHGPSLEAIEIIQVGVGGGAPSSVDGILLSEITIAYTASDHTAKLRLPPLEVPLGASVCKDNGCNPFFEMTPFRAGTVNATATWPGSGTARLTLEAGKIAAHGQSAEGEIYTSLASAAGGPGISVTGTVRDTEAAVAIRNEGDVPIVAPMLTITWP